MPTAARSALAAIDGVQLDPGAEATALGQRIVAWAGSAGVPVTREGRGGRSGREAPDAAVGPSKGLLRVTPWVGAAVKPCTGRTEGLLCCNLQVITQTVGCPLDCSYCILQAYQNRREITVCGDAGAILDEASRQVRARPDRLHRVCTGQVADSLALEPLVGFAARAVERFAGLDSALLELKTKTDNVELLLDLPHRGHTVVSWSVSPEAVSRREEHGAAPLSARLAAAARVARAGYPLAFHLDPMITRTGDPAPFVALVRQIADHVPVDRVAYVSMGTVRFQPHMRRTISARFPGSPVTQAELLPGVDGKLRLLRPLRAALYRRVAAELRQRLPAAFVYLCMEPPRVWGEALGAPYQRRQEVEVALARHVHRRLGLGPARPRSVEEP